MEIEGKIVWYNESDFYTYPEENKRLIVLMGRPENGRSCAAYFHRGIACSNSFVSEDGTSCNDVYAWFYYPLSQPDDFKVTCDSCIFRIEKDLGYSAWTVTHTTLHCRKLKRMISESYSSFEEVKPPRDCPRGIEGKGIKIDVDGPEPSEVW